MELAPLLADPGYLQTALQLYETIHGEEPATAEPRFRRHGRTSGYRGRVALVDGEVVGFAYGHDSNPGNPYHRRLQQALPPAAVDEWLDNAYEVVELAVAPESRRQGIGSRLVEAVLAGTDRTTAVLTAERNAVGARGFYEATGWQRVYEPFVVNGVEMTVFGRRIA
ncbi:GNAT family N-acetyltransferase [Halosegnis sp.]|uniref:GNAT family N-acetyltransferase n=1 Tax=Halosegnis sp. TaxID=2864959 RepID=UPI0035D4F4FA